MGYNNYNNNKNNNSYSKKTYCNLVYPYGSEKGFFMGLRYRDVNGQWWNGKCFRSEEQQNKPPVTSKSGKRWVNVTLVFNAPMHNTVFVYGMLNIDNHKVYVEDWNMMANPNAPNGGYFGKHISSNKKR
ncbi:hypothetical protein [Tenacibaculum amylolyticum]|uniref:hypothetical protein n=1 Tax=Tenacibaculum amylolyticum TaxID=104269 RepID=UPI003895DB18